MFVFLQVLLLENKTGVDLQPSKTNTTVAEFQTIQEANQSDLTNKKQ